MPDPNIFDPNDENVDLGDYIVTLTLENGGDTDFIISAIFPCGDLDYVALIPREQAESDEPVDIYLYRYTEDENGEPIFGNIEDDAEYMKAAAEFDRLATEYQKSQNK